MRTPEDIRLALTESLEEIRELPHFWDGKSAKPITKDAATRAYRIIQDMPDRLLQRVSLHPRADGSVSIEFETPSHKGCGAIICRPDKASGFVIRHSGEYRTYIHLSLAGLKTFFTEIESVYNSYTTR